uniref:Glycosyl hydrolase family 17 protein n=1 Tax=Solanum tuberosum TaxID=4113 RepID=M1CEZ8_SOLTU
MVRMANIWCVFDCKTDHNETLVLQDYEYSCGESDCTAFGAGATCDHLSFIEKVSYGYNMLYQMSNQDQRKCNLLGATITTNNPSTPDCDFPIEILTVEVVDGESTLTKRY